MERIFQGKNDKIFEINNELLYYKNIHGEGLSMTEISSNSMCKKKKIDEYVNFVIFKNFVNFVIFMNFILLELCCQKSPMLS